MPKLPPYPCTGCKEIFDSYAAYDAHRSSVHGRRADGTLLRPDGTPYPTYDARPTIEQRVATLERRIEVLCATIDAMKKASKS